MLSSLVILFLPSHNSVKLLNMLMFSMLCESQIEYILFVSPEPVEIARVVLLTRSLFPPSSRLVSVGARLSRPVTWEILF